MTKRLLKKHLSAFGYTIKDGKVKGKPTRRNPAEWFLLPSHPLARRRNERRAAEQARVLPALLNAPIGDTLKAELSRRVGEREHKPMDLPAWSEKGGKPRQRLYSAARYHRARVDYHGCMRRYNAESDAAFSALFRRWPKVIGRRIQTGNRIA
jgi:hypothetical protein